MGSADGYGYQRSDGIIIFADHVGVQRVEARLVDAMLLRVGLQAEDLMPGDAVWWKYRNWKRWPQILLCTENVWLVRSMQSGLGTNKSTVWISRTESSWY